MIRKFLTRILIMILIAVCIYNGRQTQRLQGQVAALEAKAGQPPAQTAFMPTGFLPTGFLPTGVPIAHSVRDFLQQPWKRLQNQAGILRSTRKKVLSYVKL